MMQALCRESYSRLLTMLSRHLAICSWSVQPRDPEDLIAIVRSCGLQAVQIALDPVVEDPRWKATAAALKEAGIEIISGMFATTGEDYSTLASIAKTGGVRPDANWPSTWDRAQRAADVAAALGLSLVTMHAGFLPEDPCDERDTMIDRLKQLANLFSAMNIELAFETGQETADTLVTVLQELSIPSIGVNFDPANMILYGKGDPVASLCTLSPWIRQVHIKDAVASTVSGEWGREVPVGQGDVQWNDFLQAIPQGVDLVIEREAGKGRIADIKSAVSLIQKNGVC